MTTYTFTILDKTLQVSGADDICELVYKEFDCLLFSGDADNTPDYFLSVGYENNETLNNDIPDWVRENLDIQSLEGDEEHTQHQYSEGKLFVYTRSMDGSEALFCSDDMMHFHLKVYRAVGPRGIRRIRNASIPMLLRAIGEASGYLLFHCAVVADSAGRAAAFLAHAGTGKTTLSLAMMRSGYKLLTDDLAYIGGPSGLDVFGILEKVNFTKWTADKLPECARYFEENGLDLTNRKQPLDIREIYGEEVVAERGDVAVVFLLKSDHDSPLRVEEAETAELFMKMRISQILPLAMFGGEILSGIASKVKVYELYTGPDPFKTAEWLDRNWEQLLLEPVRDQVALSV